MKYTLEEEFGLNETKKLIKNIRYESLFRCNNKEQLTKQYLIIVKMSLNIKIYSKSIYNYIQWLLWYKAKISKLTSQKIVTKEEKPSSGHLMPAGISYLQRQLESLIVKIEYICSFS